MLLESAGEVAMGVVVEIGLAAIVCGMIYRLFGNALPLPRKVVVPALHQGIVLRDAELVRIVPPGNAWVWPRQSMALCDMRPKPFQIQSQDMIAADGMGVRVSVSGEQKIIDPVAFVSQNSDSFGTFYLEMRQALRVAVSELESEAILRGQSLVTVRMEELLVPKAAQLGIELVSLEVWEAMPLGRMMHTME